MRSTDILGIGTWRHWDETAIRDAPKQPGVYVFRLDHDVQRVLGASDILYIGTTGKGKRTIKAKLTEHIRVRETIINTGSQLQRIKSEVGTVEVAWVLLADEHGASVFESELFSKYIADHIELPPLNRQESGIRVRNVFRLILKLPLEEQKKVLAQLQSNLNR
jgi:hypothetical protein